MENMVIVMLMVLGAVLINPFLSAETVKKSAPTTQAEDDSDDEEDDSDEDVISND